ncbi:MAG: Uma2 family endonuclease [Blastocatellia bacterium]
MSVATIPNYLEAIAHIPSGKSLVASGVAWEDYEQLLEDLGPSSSVRVFYDHGRMEIMSPLSRHEKPAQLIARLITTLSDALDIDVESMGATTLKKKLADAGAEPDESFYVQNAAAIIGHLDLTLETDPPPDIVVESDHTSSSLDKFPIYAALGVPEIWRISGLAVCIWLLDGGVYRMSAVSRAFPFLPVETLNEFLAMGLAEGGRKMARAFREWLKIHHQL